MRRPVKIVELERLSCAGCGDYLERGAGRHGLVWFCRECRAGAVTLPVLRQIAPRTFVNRVWQAALHASRPSRQWCPACAHPFSELGRDPLWGAAPIKVCTRCHWVWFSADLLATFDRGPAPSPPLEHPPARIAGPTKSDRLGG
jgi:hypothetical protein